MTRRLALVLASCVALLGAGAWLLLAAEDPPPPPVEAAPPEPPPQAPIARPTPAPTPHPVAVAAPALLDAATPSPEAAAGPERKAPPDLPRQFAEPEVRAAVTAALKEADSRGAAINSVDCTEHPCIIYVENVSPYDTKQILKAPSLAPYRKESGFTACFPTARSDGTGAGVCGFAYEPKIASPEEHEAALKRFRFRAEQMRDATK